MAIKTLETGNISRRSNRRFAALSWIFTPGDAG
jgi:hypothetical protein